MATSTKRKAESSSHQEKRQKRETPVFSEPTKFVTFIIGPEDKIEDFMVHKEVACFDSPVLAAAFDSNFIEGQTLKYTIEDTTPRAFRLLVQWMYSKKLELLQLPYLEPEDDEIDPTPQTPEEKSEDESLAELWILADRLIIPKLKNLVMDKMYEIFRKHDRIPLTTYHYIWKNTSDRSGIRKYILEFCLTKLEVEDIEDFEPCLPRALISSMLMRFVYVRGRDPSLIPRTFTPRTYHETRQEEVVSVASTELELLE